MTPPKQIPPFRQSVSIPFVNSVDGVVVIVDNSHIIFKVCGHDLDGVPELSCTQSL